MLLFLEVAMKHYQNPFRTLSKPEWCLWIGSLLAVAAGFLSIGERDLLTLAASLIGVTALIFVAKGDPLGQMLTVVFAVLYSLISLTFQYYGEMITYLGDDRHLSPCFPPSPWFRHPHKKGKQRFVAVVAPSPMCSSSCPPLR